MAAITMSRPIISSPLAESSRTSRATPLATPRRGTQFPSSRALRPFPSISHVFQQPKASQAQKPPVKIIEPPKNHKATFLLNLTQAELGRQD
ncbi:hypothetical protein AX17_000338 [Amanita inopinata Kibby_2008]|nr:hypothetical protein AX17_000338 [Amanita inopinata Kibby_2008]